MPAPPEGLPSLTLDTHAPDKARPAQTLEDEVFPSLLPTYARADVAFVRGEGPYLFAEDGERYLDFGAGVAVNALGHANPKLVAALMEQAQKVWHTSNNYRITGQEKLSKKLVESTFAADHGFRFADAAWNSGSPAPGTE